MPLKGEPISQASAGRSFWKAISHGDTALARRLLAAGVDPDVAAGQNYRPLMAAAANGDLRMAQLLLEAGADVHGHAERSTPLLSAALYGGEEVYRLLLSHGAKETPWTAAALDGRIGDASASEVDEGGATLLHVAARAHQVAACRTLLDHDAAPSARDRLGNSPVHAACDARAPTTDHQIDTLRLLHERGADLDASNDRGVRPLHVAVRARGLEAVRFLLERGVELDVRDSARKSTPLRRAVTNTGAGGTAGSQEIALEIARLLLDAGADPSARDAKGRTVLDSIRSPSMRALVEGYL